MDNLKHCQSVASRLIDQPDGSMYESLLILEEFEQTDTLSLRVLPDPYPHPGLYKIQYIVGTHC